MNNKFENISMMGRMAYVVMCVEKYLTEKYPKRDWNPISKVMWKATSMDWATWSDIYSAFIPEVLLEYDEYLEDEFRGIMDEKTYRTLLVLYEEITDGSEDNPEDEVNYLLNKPFEMAMVYEGTKIGNGEESYEIIDETEHILKINNIQLPDEEKVAFSKASERNGWGNYFNGEFLSIILH